MDSKSISPSASCSVVVIRFPSKLLCLTSPQFLNELIKVRLPIEERVWRRQQWLGGGATNQAESPTLSAPGDASALHHRNGLPLLLPWFCHHLSSRSLPASSLHRRQPLSCWTLDLMVRSNMPMPYWYGACGKTKLGPNQVIIENKFTINLTNPYQLHPADKPPLLP